MARKKKYQLNIYFTDETKDIYDWINKKSEDDFRSSSNMIVKILREMYLAEQKSG